MRGSRVVLSDALKRVWAEAAIRVVTAAEQDAMCALMEQAERVHHGVRDAADPRSWSARVRGAHRMCLLLEHQREPLCYLLTSVSPYTASRMSDIFEDAWEAPAAQPRGQWAHCNFYSVTALNKDRSSAFHGVPVGWPCIAKAAQFLLHHGPREALRLRALSNGGDDHLDAADSGAPPSLMTISPIPALAARVRIEGRTRDQVLKDTRALIEARDDPVAKFHLGNGASLHRLNWQADTSPQRLAESGGIMANYSYNGVPATERS